MFACATVVWQKKRESERAREADSIFFFFFFAWDFYFFSQSQELSFGWGGCEKDRAQSCWLTRRSGMVYELRMRSRSTNWNQWREINKTGASAAVRGSWYCLRRGPYSCLQRAWAFPGATRSFTLSLRNCRSPPAVCTKAQVLPPQKMDQDEGTSCSTLCWWQRRLIEKKIQWIGRKKKNRPVPAALKVRDESTKCSDVKCPPPPMKHEKKHLKIVMYLF